LVDTILSSSNDVGATTRQVNLNEIDLNSCQACNRCRESKNCFQEDGMKQLTNEMKESDVWIIGTPIYWWGTTSQMKTFIDRWYGVDQSIFQGKRMILVLSMGGSNEYYARHVVGMFEDICNYLGIQLVDTIIATSMRTKNSAKESSHLIDRARDLGKYIIQSDLAIDSKSKKSIV
jgi:multimeric flavodoxin WrbA